MLLSPSSTDVNAPDSPRGSKVLMSRRLMNLAVSEYWSLHLPTVPDRLESHSGFVRMVKDEAREDV